MRLNYARDRKRVAYFEKAAKSAAGVSKEKVREIGNVNGREEKGDGIAKVNGRENEKGKEGTVGKERRRKVRVPMVEGNDFAGTLELIVEGEEVFLVS